MTFKEAFALWDKTEALWILEKATNLTPTQLRLTNEDTPLSQEAAGLFMRMIEQRKKQIPLQYVLGSWNFMGCSIKCRPGVLIPRRDTEVLAEEVINFMKRGKETVLDLCTGSGCIAIAIAPFCAHVTASDISAEALSLAQENAEFNGVSDRMSFVQSDLFENIEGHYNCITANPPYIPSVEIESLPEDVRKEPRLALDGGPDGLDFCRAIISKCGDYLLPGGGIFLEIGHNQGKAVSNMLHEHGFRAVVVIKDFEDRDRVVRGTKAASQ